MIVTEPTVGFCPVLTVAVSAFLHPQETPLQVVLKVLPNSSNM